MRFSYKSNKFLALQKDRGRFWVDKIGATQEMNDVTMKLLLLAQSERAEPEAWHVDSSKMLSDVFNSGKFKNIYICSSVSSKVDGIADSLRESGIKSFYKAISGIANTFGCFIINNREAIIYGIYEGRVTYMYLRDGVMFSAETTWVGDNGQILFSSSFDTFRRFGYDYSDEAPQTIRYVIAAVSVYHFSDIQTIEVGGSSPKKAVIGKEKILNDTGVPIVILDTRWFTNIIRTEGFSVRGHFRLQPKKKDGEWTHELIWINDFEKHGYHSKARILNEQN